MPVLLLTVASVPNTEPGRAPICTCRMAASTVTLPFTALGSGIGFVPVHLLGPSASGQGIARPVSAQPWVSGRLCRDWHCQAEAQTQDHEGAFSPWHLSATIPKNLLSPPSPGHLKTSTFCNHFHKNCLPATVELLATGLIGSLYLLSSNGPHGDSYSGAGLRAWWACSCSQGSLNLSS